MTTVASGSKDEVRIDRAQQNGLKKLNIAHMMPWGGVGGVEIATLRLVGATQERFHHVGFCLAEATDLQSRFDKMGVETITYVPPQSSLRHGMRYYRDSAKVAELLRRAEVDLVHFSDLKAAEHNSLALVLAGLPGVCHLRISYPELSVRQRLCLLPVKKFVFVSQEARDTFAMSLKDSAAEVLYDAIVPPAIDTSEASRSIREEFGIPLEASVVGMVARVSPQKDHITLAEAAAKVLAKHPEVRFLIAGDNSRVELNRLRYAEVKTKLEQLGIEHSFIFTGHRTDIPQLIAAMDVCVLCTHREGFPLSILEIMAMKKPMIATAVGGNPEIVKHGTTGRLHDHEDASGLAEQIMALIEDPAEAKRLGMAGFEHVEQGYALASYVEQLAGIYASVLPESKKKLCQPERP